MIFFSERFEWGVIQTRKNQKTTVSHNHSDRKLKTINTRLLLKIVRRPMVKHLKLDILLFSVNPENICHQVLFGGTAFMLGVRLDAKLS
jgi:hypothetical protein